MFGVTLWERQRQGSFKRHFPKMLLALGLLAVLSLFMSRIKASLFGSRPSKKSFWNHYSTTSEELGN